MPLEHLAENTPATPSTAQNIPNGVYSVITGSTIQTLRISTITQARTADLIGKRVVSRMLEDGRWEPFAYVTEAGGVKVWQRFREQARNGANFVVFAHHLVAVLAEAAPIMQRNGRRSTYVDGNGVTVEWTLTCMECNGRIPSRAEEQNYRCNLHNPTFQSRSAADNPPPSRFSSVRRPSSRFVTPEVGYDVDDTPAPASFNGEVPAAVTNRLARSEIDSRLIR